VRSQLRRIRPLAITRAARAIVLAVILAVACSSCATSASHPPAPAKPASQSSSLGPRAFAALAGDWSGHGSGIAIDADGQFLISARTYQVCGQAPPPCDTMSGNTIIDGDLATGRLTSISGEVATGAVTRTTDPAATPKGPMKIILDPSTDSITANNITFCGASAPAGYCGA
jgi:hypothetical protein